MNGICLQPPPSSDRNQNIHTGNVLMLFGNGNFLLNTQIIALLLQLYVLAPKA